MDKLPFYFICVTLFFLPILFDTRLYSTFDLPKVLTLYVGTILALLFLSIYWLNSKKIIIKKNKLTLVLLGWLLISILATIFSCNPRVSIFGLFRHYEGLTSLFAYLTIFFIVYQYGLKYSSILIGAILSAGTLTSIYGLIQHLELDPISWVGCGSKYRLSSSFGNPVFFSAYLAIIVPIATKFILEKSGIKLLFSIILFSFLYWTFLMTNTRGCIVGLGVGLLFFLFYLGWQELKRLYRRLLIIGVIFFFITLIINMNPNTSFLGRFAADMVLSKSHPDAPKAISLFSTQDNKIEEGEKETISFGLGGSAALRIFLWQDVMNIIKDFPILGTGVDTLGLIYLKYRQKKVIEYEGDAKADSAHNELLDVGYSRGIIGILFYLWLFFVIFVILVKYRHLQGQKERLLAASCASGMLAYLVQAQFSFGITPVLSLFWAVAGLSLATIQNKYHTFQIKLKRHIKLILLIIIFSFSILSFYLIFRAYMADFTYRKATLLKGKVEDEVYIGLMKAAKEWNPYEAWYREEYERILLEKIKEKDKEEIDRILKELKETTELFPQDSNAYNTLGLGYYYASNLGIEPELYTKLAKEAFLKATEYNPLYAGAYNNLGIIHASKSEYNKTLYYFTEGLKADRRSMVSVDNLSKLAELFIYYKDYEKAAICYENIVNFAEELDSSYKLQIYTKLAQLYYEKLKYRKKFEKLCKRMIEEFPSYKEAYINLAKYYYLNSKYSYSLKILDRLEKSGQFTDEAAHLKALIKSKL